MELVELTAENIDDYCAGCLSLQKSLLKPGKEPNEQFIRETAKTEYSYFLALVEDGSVVGMGVISKIVHPVHVTGYVNNIVVHESMRGRGLFSTIMDALEAKAVEWGCDEFALTCSRPLVKPLYEKRGYLPKETQFYTKKR